MKAVANNKPPTPTNPSRRRPNHHDQLQVSVVEAVSNFIDRVQKNISVYDMLFSNNLPQRCLKHNNVITLYCQNQRLPICVSCMYHGTDHKSHKVVPLKNAIKPLATDTQNLRNKLQKIIEKAEQTVRISVQNLVKIERIYPEICGQIEMNFKNLYETLKMKELEQMKELYEKTEQLRSNHLIVIEEFNRLICYCVEKDPPDVKSDDEDAKVYSRNVLQSLIEPSKLVEMDIKPIEVYDYPQSGINVFKEIQNFALQKLQTQRFPQIIAFSKDKLNLGQDFNIKPNARNDSSMFRHNTPTRLGGPKITVGKTYTPERQRSRSGSFRLNTSRQDIK